MNENLDIRNPEDIRWSGVPIDKMTREQLVEALRSCAISYWRADPPNYGWDPWTGKERG